MDKWKIILIAAAIIGAAALFYPRDAGSGCGFCGPSGAIWRTENECIGIKAVIPRMMCSDCGPLIKCFGIPTDEKHCYTYMSSNNEYVELPECKEVDTLSGLIALCPDCYSEASHFAAREERYEEALSYCSKLGEDINCKSYVVRQAFENNFTQICDIVDIQTVECLKVAQDES